MIEFVLDEIRTWYKQRNIPPGPYCYRIKNIRKGPNGYPTIRTVPCPYWESLGNMKARCNYLDVQDEEPQDTFTLLWDRCKACGVKEGD